jgi:hypothetical protein
MFFFQKMPTFKAFFFRWILPIASTSFTSFPTAEKKQIFVFSFSFYIPGLSGRPFAGSLRSNLKNIPAKLFASISV